MTRVFEGVITVNLLGWLIIVTYINKVMIFGRPQLDDMNVLKKKKGN